MVVSDAECEKAESDSVVRENKTTGMCETDLHGSYKDKIQATHLCAGAPGKGSCQGDSGGPLTVKDSQTGQHRLAGIVSTAIGCAVVSNMHICRKLTWMFQDDLFTVFTEVAMFSQWIDEKTEEHGGALYCPF